MNPLFADTFYFLALANSKDTAHAKALEFSRSHRGPLLTTTWVLTELADGLSRAKNRHLFLRVLDDLRSDPAHIVIPPSMDLFEEGIALYRSRPDKHWSLTDCISFVVMTERRLTDALTGDHHFEQAGFRALLL